MRLGMHAIDLTVVAILTLLAAGNLVDVFCDGIAWLLTAVPATLLGCLIALTGCKPSLRLWLQAVVLMLAQFVIGPIVTMNDTAIGHVLPSTRTLSDGWQQTFGAFKHLISITPPIGNGNGALMALWTLALWSAFLTGLFAVSVGDKPSPLCMPSTFAAFAASALLGTATGWHRAAAGIATAMLLVVWLSARWGLLHTDRWLGASAMLLSAAVLAGCVCAVTPQHRMMLRDRYEPPISPYAYTSPLSTLRSYITQHKDDTILTVRGLPAGTPVRLAVMDRFDGNVWNLSDSPDRDGSSQYRRVGTAIADTTKGKQFTATFSVGEGLSDVWLPLAGTASGITFHGDDKNGAVYYNTDNASALYPSGVRPGLTYTQTGVVPDSPSEQDIESSRAASVSQPQSRDVPGSVGTLARAIAGGQAQSGKAARALANRLNGDGWFSHGLQGDYPSLPGHGNRRIDGLLTGTVMVGNAEQYASAMALMARELGLPSRVVLGFTQKDRNGRGSASRTIGQGTHAVVEFRGNDIDAWVEIKFDGLGWVAFHPTPQETKTPDDVHEPSPPNPETLVRQPPPPLVNPLRDRQQVRGTSSLSGDNANRPADPFWNQVRAAFVRLAIWSSPLWSALLACGGILLVKAIRWSRASRRGTPGMRITAGWRAFTSLARQSGAHLSGTRREQAQCISQQLHLDATDARRLSDEADCAAFSGQPTTAERAEAYWKDVNRMRARLLASLPIWRRWRTLMSWQGLFRGI